MGETFWNLVAAGTSSIVSSFLSVAMDFIASGAGAGFWETFSWFLLFYGTLAALCLSPLAKNKIALVAFTVLVLGLAVGHGFYIDYISSAFDNCIGSLSPNGTSALNTNGTLPRYMGNTNGTLPQYAAIQADYYSKFTFLAYWTEVLIFIFFCSPVVVMVLISWSRVWRGQPIAPWQRLLSAESANKPPSTKGILKVGIESQKVADTLTDTFAECDSSRNSRWSKRVGYSQIRREQTT
jgi:hypothetical protein